MWPGVPPRTRRARTESSLCNELLFDQGRYLGALEVAVNAFDVKRTRMRRQIAAGDRVGVGS